MARRRLVLDGAALEAVERLARSAGVSAAELIKNALRREDDAQQAKAETLSQPEPHTLSQSTAEMSGRNETPVEAKASTKRASSAMDLRQRIQASVDAERALARERVAEVLRQHPTSNRLTKVVLGFTNVDKVLAISVANEPFAIMELKRDTIMAAMIGRVEDELRAIGERPEMDQTNVPEGHSYIGELVFYTPRQKVSEVLDQVFDVVASDQTIPSVNLSVPETRRSGNRARQRD